MRTKMTVLVIAVAFAAAVACEDERTGLVDSGRDSGFQDSGPPDSGPPDSGSPDASCVPPTTYGCFFHAGQDVWVDGFGGTDDAGACCCGQPFVPCQTLTYAMATIADGGTIRVKIHAYMSDGGEIWPNSVETWPVHLGWGVTVTAPNIWFSPPYAEITNDAVFHVYPYDPTDDYLVTVQGDTTDPEGQLKIGLIADGGRAVWGGVLDPPPAIAYVGLPLQLNNIWMSADAYNLVASSNAQVLLGPLPIHLGSFFGRYPTQGGVIGIDCQQATIEDIGDHTVQIDSQGDDIVGHYGCSLTLTHGPSLGMRPDGGYGSCPSPKPDFHGLSIASNATVTLGSPDQPAELHCFQNNAIAMDTEGEGAIPPILSPVVVFVGNESNSDCYGAWVGGGSLTATSSTFAYNAVGIWVFDTGVLMLDSFTEYVPYPPPNQITCNSFQENPNARCYSPPGHSVPYNANVAITDGALASRVDLNNVVWNHWDSTAMIPQTWTCFDTSYHECNCLGPGCPSATDGGSLSLRAGNQADVLYEGPAVDAGPFIFGSGSEGTCP
jgi:hypothetical protein